MDRYEERLILVSPELVFRKKQIDSLTQTEQPEAYGQKAPHAEKRLFLQVLLSSGG